MGAAAAAETSLGDRELQLCEDALPGLFVLVNNPSLVQ